MMRLVRLFAFLSFAFAALILAAGSPQAQAQTQTQVIAPPKLVAKSASLATRSGGIHVYLLRGWLDVFSTGMDDLTVKLNRRGIRASVHGYTEYYSLADSIAARYRAGSGERVVIIGHSLGANAAVEMAARLGELKVPVPLVITYDPTIVENAPGNVSRLVNFFQSNNGWGTRVAAGPAFRGSLSNIDLASSANLDHVSIDKSNKLHMQSIAYIQSLGGGKLPIPAVRPAPLPFSSAKETTPVSSQAPASSTEKRPPL